MGVLESLQVLTHGAAWRLTGSTTSGRRLIGAVVAGDEDARTLAGMLLVKSGDRGRRLVVETLEGGVESEELVTVLQSIGDPEAEAELRRLANQEDRRIADSARKALAELEQIRRRPA